MDEGFLSLLFSILESVPRYANWSMALELYNKMRRAEEESKTRGGA